MCTGQLTRNKFDRQLAVTATAFGERPVVRRVPMTATEKRLPPQRWEESRLPSDRVLVILRFQRRMQEYRPPAGTWLRGTPPALPPSEIELLRLEFVQPPAVRRPAAERATRAALRSVAQTVHLAPPAASQLRQLQQTSTGIRAFLN